jgi:hypothetical protein
MVLYTSRLEMIESILAAVRWSLTKVYSRIWLSKKNDSDLEFVIKKTDAVG